MTYEPEKYVFEAYKKAYVGIVKRSGLGSYCGYVALPEEAENVDWEKMRLEVHGGVTFQDYLPDSPFKDRIHVGFDAAHTMDFVPSLPILQTYNGNLLEYRDFMYMYGEVVDLAFQIDLLHNG